MRKVLPLMVLVLFLGACGASVTAVGTTKTPVTPPTPTTVVGPGHVGQTISYSDGLAAKLVAVNTIQPSQYDTVKPGDVFVVVTVKILNGSSTQVSYNEFDFSIENGGGNITNTAFTEAYTANNLLNSGQLAPGGSVTGDMVFEAQPGDHQTKLLWKPTFGYGDNPGWLLGL